MLIDSHGRFPPFLFFRIQIRNSNVFSRPENRPSCQRNEGRGKKKKRREGKFVPFFPFHPPFSVRWFNPGISSSFSSTDKRCRRRGPTDVELRAWKLRVGAKRKERGEEDGIIPATINPCDAPFLPSPILLVHRFDQAMEKGRREREKDRYMSVYGRGYRIKIIRREKRCA